MAQNSTDQYRKFRYYEGVCSSGDFIKELANVLCLGVRKDAVIDGDGNVKEEAKVLRKLNWDIVYPNVSKNKSYYKWISNRDDYLANYATKLSEDEKLDKIRDQISKITDRVVLRTETTPIDITSEEVDDLSVSGETDMASRDMYLQIYKPRYIANPEEYPLDAELRGLTPQLITKEMYREARKSTASVIYDLAQIVSSPLIDDGSGTGRMIPDPNGDYDNVNFHGVDADPDDFGNDGLVTKRNSFEYVDAVSDSYTKDYLFNDKDGILQPLCTIFGVSRGNIEQVIQIPTENNRTTTVIIPRAYLNSIKLTETQLYEFIFGICSAKATFTETDYDLIDELRFQVSVTGNSVNDFAYHIVLSYKKKVEIFSIRLGGLLNVVKEYGHESLENIKPEIYSEGRYVPLPDKYLGDPDTTQVVFSDENQIQFCLDKVTDPDVLYGTIVLRYEYDKQFNYTDLSSLKITDSITLENNHYCLMRIFDNPNSDFSGPEPNVYDEEGNVTRTKSHTAPWSKLSWYQDFEEIMMDHIDEDVSVTNVTDGTLLVPLETAGLTSDTRISYWINTNNDRFSLIVMGNPALDYERDRHLISSCYCGRIDSFENSVNDVSGNFALYTSSSTTPCKTDMKPYDTMYRINMDFENKFFVNGASGMASDNDNFAQKYPDAVDRDSNIKAYIANSEKIGGLVPYSNVEEDGVSIYYITLTGNKFFYEADFPRYMLLDSNNNPIQIRSEGGTAIFYDNVNNRRFIRSNSDSRAAQVAIMVNKLTGGAKPAKVAFNFGYFEEKFIITSGITRDMFGNVIGIETIDDYGKNTSDGTLSVSMFHTRSKAFYQRHHFLFATTEEYMSKVMYGKSSYTGEYYADRIKITHGNDGPRGILCDTLVIDSSSLYPKDELVINKDFSKSKVDMEETFTYFPVTAPFSPLSDGPNARYGIALKKSEREPVYTDPQKILKIAKNELNINMANITNVDKTQVLPQQTENGCMIYWKVLGNVDDNGQQVFNNWIVDEDNGQSVQITFNDGTVSNYIAKKYDAPNVNIVIDEFKMGTGNGAPTKIVVDEAEKSQTQKTIDFMSEIKIKLAQAFPYVSGNITHAFYGYSDSELGTIGGDTVITKILDDGTSTADYTDNIHEYAFEGDYFVDLSNEINLTAISSNNGEITNFTQRLYNAHPDKYLNIYFVKEDQNTRVGQIIDPQNPGTFLPVYNKVIVNYMTLPLHYDDSLDDDTMFAVGKCYYDLLQYPCSVTFYTSGVTNSNTQGILSHSVLYNRYEMDYCEYATQVSVRVQNMAGSINVLKMHYGSPETISLAVGNNVVIPASMLIDDLFVKIEH